MQSREKGQEAFIIIVQHIATFEVLLLINVINREMKQPQQNNFF